MKCVTSHVGRCSRGRVPGPAGKGWGAPVLHPRLQAAGGGRRGGRGVELPTHLREVSQCLEEVPASAITDWQFS